MVKRAHVVEDGIVVNTILVDDISDGILDFDQYGGGIGWLWDGVALTPPPPPAPTPPDAVSMRQARLALLGAGLLSNVNAALEAMQGIEGEAARIEWEYATEVRRESPLVAGLAGALGLDNDQLDQLFVAAGNL